MEARKHGKEWNFTTPGAECHGGSDGSTGRAQAATEVRVIIQFGVSYLPLQDLLAQSDWVVPQLPADPSTRHFIDRERLALMKPGACLVNVSRAEAVERNALIEALRSGHLGGFALDPLYEEPGRPDDELLAFDNVILTPHLAGSPRSNGLRDIEQMITELAQALFE